MKRNNAYHDFYHIAFVRLWGHLIRDQGLCFVNYAMRQRGHLRCGVKYMGKIEAKRVNLRGKKKQQ